MQIAKDIHKLLVLTQLHIYINQGNLLYRAEMSWSSTLWRYNGENSTNYPERCPTQGSSQHDMKKQLHSRVGLWIQDLVLKVQVPATKILWGHPRLSPKSSPVVACCTTSRETDVQGRVLVWCQTTGHPTGQQPVLGVASERYINTEKILRPEYYLVNK